MGMTLQEKAWFIAETCKQFISTTADTITPGKVEEVTTIKEFQEDQRLFTSVVLRPGKADLHGHIFDAGVVEKACHDYSQYCGVANLEHAVNTDQYTVVESYIAKSNMKLGDSDILKHDWVATMKIHDDESWAMCKRGELTAFSPGNKSMVVTLKGAAIADEQALKEWAATLKDL